MTTIGYATLQIVPSLRGVSAAIEKQLQGVDNQGRAAGKRLGDGIADGVRGTNQNVLGNAVSDQRARDIGTKVGKIFGTAIVGAAGAGIAGIGYTLTKGFERLQSIDQARFKLKALGNDADTVQKIMDSALESVKGTAFSMDQAANAAASAVAAGIKPGQELTKYLSETADAAAVAGSSFEDMGSIFNKVQTNNKAYTDDLQQLADRGLPIFQWLQKEYGVTAEALSKMVQDGEVDAAHFQKAVADNIGGAAQDMGQSFEGSIQNLQASVARAGANLLTAIFGGDSSDALAGPTEAVGALTEKFDQIGEWVKAHAPEIRDFFTTIANDVKVVGGQLQTVLGFLAEHPHAIEAVVLAFAAWKTIEGVSSLTNAIGGVGGALDRLPGKASSSAGLINKALAAVVIPAALLEVLQVGADELHQKFSAAFDQNWQNSRRAQDIGAAPRQPGVGELGGAPAVGQTGPVRAPAPRVGNELRDRIAAGQLPGYSLAPNGDVIGPDGRPVKLPGLDTGGYTGNMPISQIAGFVHGDEHVIRATSRRSIENLYPGLLDFMNNNGRLPGYADGGVVGNAESLAASLNGLPYIYGSRDCSKVQSDIYAVLTGKSTGQRYFTTESDFAALGFLPGSAAGAYNIGVRRGGGGKLSHMAGTLPNGVNFEAGGSDSTVKYGGSASGADDFPLKFYLPVTGGDPSGGVSGASSPFAGGSATAAVSGGRGFSDFADAGSSSGSSGSSGGSISLPSSLSGLASFGLGDLGKGVGTTNSGSDLSLFGKAAESAVTGQVSSALDVFGIPSSPGWLQGISQLIGGISIGGGGGSASPFSAASAGTGTPPPGDPGNMHGTRASQAPGVTYNITARDTEDAFVKAQRQERERMATKLSRY